MKYIKIIRDLREDHDLTQKQVADVLGTSQTIMQDMNEVPTSCQFIIC